MDETALRAEVSAGRIQASTLVWRTGMERWQSVDMLKPDWWALHSPAPLPAKTTQPTTRALTSNAQAAEPREGGFLKKIFGFGKKRA